MPFKNLLMLRVMLVVECRRKRGGKILRRLTRGAELCETRTLLRKRGDVLAAALPFLVDEARVLFQEVYAGASTRIFIHLSVLTRCDQLRNLGFRVV